MTNMADENPINNLYNYLMKGKHAPHALNIIKTLYENRKVGYEYIDEKGDFYKALKILVAYMNSSFEQYAVLNRRENCKALFERYRFLFKEAYQIKFTRIDVSSKPLGACSSLLEDYGSLFDNRAILVYEKKHDKQAEFDVYCIRTILEDGFFAQEHML